MAFFQLVLKARSAEKARQRYEDEKLRSIDVSAGTKPQYTLGQRFRRKKFRCKQRVKGFWSKITCCSEDTWFHRKRIALRTDGTFENYIMKSLVGFFAGVLLTYTFFAFFVLQLHFALSTATILCTVIGTVLTLGLAFSFRVRCIVLLLLPQFFSKRGRQALMAYVFILALTGPVKNILLNVGVLTESLTCGQEQLKEAVKQVVDLIKQPFNSLREAISKVIKTMKVVVKNIKRTLLAIKRLVLSILHVITSVFQWLGSVVNICNKNLGTPFDRCQNVFEGAVADCRAKLGPVFSGICNLTYIVSALCYVVKPLDFICMLVSYVADAIVDAVKKRVKKFTDHMKAMFYVKIKFSHSFHFETNQSKTVQDVSRGIVTEIRSRTGGVLTIFDWMSFLTTFFVFFMLLRIIHYRNKWLTKEQFDNRYITQDLRTIDLVRARQDKETVLPLNSRERNRYVPLTSITLIKTEKIRLAKTAIFLSLATFKILIYIAVDYSLWWILHIIQYHGRIETKVQEPNVITVDVSGDGYLAQLYKSIIKAFTPDSKESEVNTAPCLPDPLPPNFDRYTHMVFLILLCWIMMIFEPYGLRIRHAVLGYYYPARAKQRATWLFNHIIRSRGSFLKFARRQLRRRFGIAGAENVEQVTLKERLIAVCPVLHVCFPVKQNLCLICGAVERTDKNPHIKCSTPGCVGLFCIECFADLQNLCTICRLPVEYGDLSDISEEKDSSEDALESLEGRLKTIRSRDSWRSGVSDREKIDRKDQDFDTEETGLIEGEEAEGTTASTEKYQDSDNDPLDTESSYSYSYQDESATETEDVQRKVWFKDVEAQKKRDDVTIQIFHDPSLRETASSSESAKSHREFGARLKKGACASCRHKIDTDSSIAETESWPSEEEEEEKETSKELLPKYQSDKKKRGRLKKIVRAVARIPFAGSSQITESEGREKSSLMQKIIRVFRSGSKKKDQYEKMESNATWEESRSSVSSYTSDESDETETLIKNENYLRDTDGQRRRFSREKIPEHFESVSKVTYYKVDEINTPLASQKLISKTEDDQKLNTWNTIDDDALHMTGSQSDSIHQASKDKSSYLRDVTTASGPSNDISKLGSDSETIDWSIPHADLGYMADIELQDTTTEYEQSGRGFGVTEERSELQVSLAGRRCSHIKESSTETYDSSSCECSRESINQDTSRSGTIDPYEQYFSEDRSRISQILRPEPYTIRSRKYSSFYHHHPESVEESVEDHRTRPIRRAETGTEVSFSSSKTEVESSESSTSISQEMDPSFTVSLEGVEGEGGLPYQQTEAYRNVVNEFRRKAVLRDNENPEESVPLAPLLMRPDSSNELRQLHPPETRSHNCPPFPVESDEAVIGTFRSDKSDQRSETSGTHCKCSTNSRSTDTSTVNKETTYTDSET